MNKTEHRDTTEILLKVPLSTTNLNQTCNNGGKLCAPNAFVFVFTEFDDNDGASSSDMSEYGWDDSDEDVDDQPPVSKSGKKGKGTTQPSVKDYMDMMDRELATTEVGKSFEKVASEEKPVSAPNVKVCI